MPKEAYRSRVKCLLCGEKQKDLSRHLRFKHRMTNPEYRTRFGTAAHVISESSSRQRSLQMKRFFKNPEVRLRSKEKRRDLIPDWLIVQRVVQGQSHGAIARELGRTQTVISDRARQLGLASQCHYYLGRPFDCETVKWVKERTGLFARVLATESGVSTSAMEEAQWPKHPGQRIKPETAKKFAVWLDRAIAGLLTTDFRKRLVPPDIWHKCSKHSLLLTLVPHLHANYTLLLRVLGCLRTFLRTNLGADVERALKYLCDQARFEVAGASRDDIFRSFLPWAPELAPFLERDIGRLRGFDALERIAHEWLAARCHTTASVLNNALKRRTSLVSPPIVASLIHSLTIRSQSSAPPEMKPKAVGPGRPAKRRETFLAALPAHENEGLSWRQCAERFLPEEFKKDPKRAAELLRRGVIHLKSQRRIVDNLLSA